MLEKQAFHTFILKQALSARDFISDPGFSAPQGLTQHALGTRGGISARGVNAGGEGLKRFSDNAIQGAVKGSPYGAAAASGMAAKAVPKMLPAAAKGAVQGVAQGAAKGGLSSMMSGALGKLKWPLAGLGALGAYKLMSAPTQHQDYMSQTGGMPYVG